MTPRKLLEQLAGYHPINQDEMGGCVFCCGSEPGVHFGNAGRYLSDHSRGCPWVKARRLLGDKLPAKRESNARLSGPQRPAQEVEDGPK